MLFFPRYIFIHTQLVRLDSIFRKYTKNAKGRALLVINPTHLSLEDGRRRWFFTDVHLPYMHIHIVFRQPSPDPTHLKGFCLFVVCSFWLLRLCMCFSLCLKHFYLPIGLMNSYLSVTAPLRCHLFCESWTLNSLGFAKQIHYQQGPTV